MSKIRNCRRCGALTDQPQFCSDYSACVAVAFWSKVDKSGGPDACWPWLGKRDKDGYGTFAYRDHGWRVWMRATRFALHLSGVVLGDLLACHRCDNPPCCNPAHLFPGTQLENRRDSAAKGRDISGERWYRHQRPQCKINPEIVRQIRARKAAGESGAAIGRDLGLSRSAVNIIARRAQWKHVA